PPEPAAAVIVPSLLTTPPFDATIRDIQFEPADSSRIVPRLSNSVSTVSVAVAPCPRTHTVPSRTRERTFRAPDRTTSPESGPMTTSSKLVGTDPVLQLVPVVHSPSPAAPVQAISVARRVKGKRKILTRPRKKTARETAESKHPRIGRVS